MLMDVKKRPESTNMTVSVLSKIMQGKVHFQWKIIIFVGSRYGGS